MRGRAEAAVAAEAAEAAVAARAEVVAEAAAEGAAEAAAAEKVTAKAAAKAAAAGSPYLLLVAPFLEAPSSMAIEEFRQKYERVSRYGTMLTPVAPTCTRTLGDHGGVACCGNSKSNRGRSSSLTWSVVSSCTGNQPPSFCTCMLPITWW